MRTCLIQVSWGWRCRNSANSSSSAGQSSACSQVQVDRKQEAHIAYSEGVRGAPKEAHSCRVWRRPSHPLPLPLQQSDATLARKIAAQPFGPCSTYACSSSAPKPACSQRCECEEPPFTAPAAAPPRSQPRSRTRQRTAAARRAAPRAPPVHTAAAAAAAAGPAPPPPPPLMLGRWRCGRRAGAAPQPRRQRRRRRRLAWRAAAAAVWRRRCERACLRCGGDMGRCGEMWGDMGRCVRQTTRPLE